MRHLSCESMFFCKYICCSRLCSTGPTIYLKSETGKRTKSTQWSIWVANQCFCCCKFKVNLNLKRTISTQWGIWVANQFKNTFWVGTQCFTRPFLNTHKVQNVICDSSKFSCPPCVCPQSSRGSWGWTQCRPHCKQPSPSTFKISCCEGIVLNVLNSLCSLLW